MQLSVISNCTERLFPLPEDVFFQTREKNTIGENSCPLVKCGSHMAALSSLTRFPSGTVLICRISFSVTLFSTIWRYRVFTE